MKRALLVFDHRTHQRYLSKKLQSARINEIDLFPLTSEWNLIERVENLCKSTKFDMREVSLLNSAQLINDEVDKIRERVSSWSSYLGEYNVCGRPIKEWFLTPRKEVSTWWFSLISEKNTFQTDVFFEIAQLQAIELLVKVKKYNLCYLSITDKKLQKAAKELCKKYSLQSEILPVIFRKLFMEKDLLKDYLREFGFIKDIFHSLSWFAMSVFRACYAKIMMGPLGNRSLVKDSLLFVTYFPAVNKEVAKKGIFKNEYSAALQDKLSAIKKPIIWLLMYIPTEGISFSNALRLGKKFAQAGQAVFFIEEFFSVRVIFNTILTWVNQVLKYLFLSFKLDARFLTENLTFPEADILLYPVWRKSVVGKKGIEGILYFELYKEIFDYFGALSHCIYYAEMQSWEKALSAAKRLKARRIKTIGFLHTNIGKNQFCYFYDKKEIENRDTSLDLPLPDVIACNGEIPYRLLKEQNYPNLIIVEAIRQLYLIDYLKDDTGYKKGRHILLIAGSYYIKETALLILLLQAAFPEKRPFEVWIKGHPLMPPEKAFDLLNIDYKKYQYQIKHDSLDTLLKDTTMVLVGFSNVGLEALVFGCKVFIPIFAEHMFMSPLQDFENYYSKVSTPGELKLAVETFIKYGRDEDFNDFKNFILRYWCLDTTLNKWQQCLSGSGMLN